MGRYASKITHTFSEDPTRPTFNETVQQARTLILKNYIEKLEAEERECVLHNLQEEGYIS